MARPENRSEARALSLTLPIETFNYLVLLATLGKLGRTETKSRRIFSFARHTQCMRAASTKSAFPRPTSTETAPAVNLSDELRVLTSPPIADSTGGLAARLSELKMHRAMSVARSVVSHAISEFFSAPLIALVRAQSTGCRSART